MLVDKTDTFLGNAEDVIEDVLGFPEQVIDFGVDLQKRLEAFGERIGGQLTEQGANVRGAEIGERIANFLYKWKEPLAIGGILTAIYFVVRK